MQVCIHFSWQEVWYEKYFTGNIWSKNTFNNSWTIIERKISPHLKDIKTISDFLSKKK